MQIGINEAYYAKQIPFSFLLPNRYLFLHVNIIEKI